MKGIARCPCEQPGRPEIRRAGDYGGGARLRSSIILLSVGRHRTDILQARRRREQGDRGGPTMRRLERYVRSMVLQRMIYRRDCARDFACGELCRRKITSYDVVPRFFA